MNPKVFREASLKWDTEDEARSLIKRLSVLERGQIVEALEVTDGYFGLDHRTVWYLRELKKSLGYRL